MTSSLNLSNSQVDLLSEFYSHAPVKVVLPKSDRQEIWHSFRNSRNISKHSELAVVCPALFAELSKSIQSSKHIQSAIFSECIYAQTLADMFHLKKFKNQLTDSSKLDSAIETVLRSHGLFARYVYENATGSRVLVQAGGASGVDSALISITDNRIFTIEFKEPLAKTSEPDLPKYGEDGYLVTSTEFSKKYPQFDLMIEEQIEKKLNFFSQMGSNVNQFNPSSVQIAVAENYSGDKFADVICTEDATGFFTMVPADQAHMWAELQGEIRPSGRNPYAVWTPNRLLECLNELGGKINEGLVTIDFDKLTPSAPRGGSGISRYKINPIFFVRPVNLTTPGSVAQFKLSDVEQLNPTIAAKMDFKSLSIVNVKAKYAGI